MSLTDEQKAIAKVQAQGCRRWMSLIILAPVLLCASLTLIAPTVRDYLVRREATEQCQVLATQADVIPISTIVDDDTFSGTTVITADNLEQLVFLGDTTLDTVSARDAYSVIGHPNGDYVIYIVYQSSEASSVFICDDGKALGAFTADASVGSLVFKHDGSLFALADGQTGQVMVFDGLSIERLETLTIEQAHIQSLAFHPTEPLLFFTSEDSLFVYDTRNYSQLLRLAIGETLSREIGFNADGSLLYLAETGENSNATVWGIGE